MLEVGEPLAEEGLEGLGDDLEASMNLSDFLPGELRLGHV